MSAITPELLAHVKREEGWSAEPYLCPAGYATIGWGRRIPSLDHPPVTQAEEEPRLKKMLEGYWQGVLRLSPSLAQASPRRQAAITDFSYNAGVAAYADSTLRKRVDEGDWPGAAVQMRRWVYGTVKGKKVKLPGLVRRRETTAKWLEEG